MTEHRWHQDLRDTITEEYGEAEKEGEHSQMAGEQACTYFEEGLGYKDADMEDPSVVFEMYEVYLAYKWLSHNNRWQ